MNPAVQFSVDNEGYLVNPDDWTEEACLAVAAQEGIQLDESYWPVIHFIRDYWLEHRVAPDVRHVFSFMAKEQGINKKFAKAQLFKMFPYGYVKQACRIAGMKRPRAWSTG